jgi:hypothetical protein
VSANYLRLTFTTNFSTIDAAEVLVNTPSRRAREVSEGFVQRCIETPMSVFGVTVFSRLQAAFPTLRSLGSPRLTAIGWTGMLIAMFLAAILAARGPQVRVKLAGALAIVVAGFGVYLFGLASLYYYAFDSSEGLKSAQFGRYVWTYLCGISMAGWGLMAHLGGAQNGAHKASSRVALAVCLEVSMFLYLFENPSWQVVQPSSWAQGPAIRSRIAPQMDFIRAKTSVTDNVYVVFQHTTELDRMAIRYELAPRHANSQWQDYSPGGPEGGVGPQGWKDILIHSQYTHVYVGDVDEAFQAAFGGLFEGGRDPKDFLYSVSQDGRGGVRLTAVR